MSTAAVGDQREVPANGIRGLKYLRYDIMSGMVVSLVSLPLSSGIAIASGNRVRELVTASDGAVIGAVIESIQGELTRVGAMEDVGGKAYVMGLVDGMPRSTNVESYAGIVKEAQAPSNKEGVLWTNKYVGKP